MFPTHLTINNHQTPSEAQAHDVPHRHWQHPPRTWWPASHNFIVESTQFHVFFSSRNSMSVPNARCGRTLKVWFWVRTKVNEKESEFQLELNPTAFYKHTRWHCTHILPSLRLASTLKQTMQISSNFFSYSQMVISYWPLVRNPINFKTHQPMLGLQTLPPPNSRSFCAMTIEE